MEITPMMRCTTFASSRSENQNLTFFLQVRSHPEIYRGRHGRASGYGRDGPVYYVIPGGMNVIFQDEYGKEINR